MYDLIIVGAGMAGMTASIYASRYGLKHLIFGQDPGGQGNLAHLVENYPGFLSIEGPKLMQKIIEQVESYGVKIRREKVGGLRKEPSECFFSIRHSRLVDRNLGHRFTSAAKKGALPKSPHYKKDSFGLFKVKTEKGEYETKALILAMGASYRHLNIPGEEKFLGRGVSYCVSCDGPLFKGKTVAVVGGGDSAVSGAIHVSNFAQKVYLIHRREEFRAERAWVEKLKKKKNIKLILSAVVKEVFGKDGVEGIRISNSFAKAKFPSGSKHQVSKIKALAVDGIFIEIGQIPSSVLAKSIGVEVDKRGYVLVGPDMATNVLGVFAAGDLAAQKGGILFRQFITSASDGARAAASVYQYLTKKTVAPSWGKV